MDLRSLNLSESAAQEAASVLNYQPFIITSELQTGVAYSILHHDDPRVSPPLVFHRGDWSDESWNKITSANQALRTMYDAFVETIAGLYPGKSLLDVACNNGYFPVAAEKAGMRLCAGMDLGPQHADSIRFLNNVLGTDVEFFQRRYSPVERCAAALPRKFDVVCASAILCHLPDPLNFLAYLGSLANEAVFYWGQTIDTEHFIVSYNQPHPALGVQGPFPYRFNDNTRISIGLFKHAMESMGFSRLVEIPFPSWIPENHAPGLESELASGSRHRALLFVREPGGTRGSVAKASGSDHNVAERSTNRGGPNYVSLHDQQPISFDEALRAKAACRYVRSSMDQRGQYIESHGLDRDVWMPAANWHLGRNFYEYTAELLAGNTDLIELLRLYSQQFTGNALWSMTTGKGKPSPPLERALIEERQGSIELDEWALDIWEKLRDQLPDYLRISPPAKFGEVGWRVDGTLVNRDTVAYWERLLVLYRAGFLDRNSPRRLREGSRVLEIGGGYGALAWYIQEAVPGVSYTMADLPESLVYAAIYLDVLHPGSTRFLANYEFPEILHQGEACDLVINTLSMSEMSEEQVRAYCVGIKKLIGATGAFFEQNQDNTSLGMLSAQEIIQEYFSKQEMLGGPRDRPTHLMQGFANVWHA